jgi:hypothetical protein
MAFNGSLPRCYQSLHTTTFCLHLEPFVIILAIKPSRRSWEAVSMSTVPLTPQSFFKKRFQLCQDPHVKRKWFYARLCWFLNYGVTRQRNCLSDLESSKLRKPKYHQSDLKQAIARMEKYRAEGMVACIPEQYSMIYGASVDSWEFVVKSGPDKIGDMSYCYLDELSATVL